MKMFLTILLLSLCKVIFAQYKGVYFDRYRFPIMWDTTHTMENEDFIVLANFAFGGFYYTDRTGRAVLIDSTDKPVQYKTCVWLLSKKKQTITLNGITSDNELVYGTKSPKIYLAPNMVITVLDMQSVLINVSTKDLISNNTETELKCNLMINYKTNNRQKKLKISRLKIVGENQIFTYTGEKLKLWKSKNNLK